MADTCPGAQERNTAAATSGGDAADSGVVGDTGAGVIGGAEIVDEDAAGGRDVRQDPDLEPIHDGDVSETPAAQGQTRGAGTGADLGTGGEVGTTHPGAVASDDTG